jgi:hypothetical protein
MKLIHAASKNLRFRSIGSHIARVYRSCLRFCSERDKQQHFWLSLAIVSLALLIVGFGPAVLISASAGLAKEIWDHYYGSGFCWYDLLADALGIGVATFVWFWLMS